MVDQIKTNTKVVTGRIRMSYANLFTPRAMLEGQDPKYSLCVLISKSDKETINVNQFELIKLENSIASLDKNLQEVINGIYIEKKKRADVCKSLFVSENNLNRYRKKGLEEIAIIFQTYRLAIC